MRFGSLSFLMYLFMLVCYTHVLPCIHKVQWIHRRQGAKVPKKIAVLSDNGNVGLRVCVRSFMITHTQCFMLIVVYKVIYYVVIA